MSRDAGLEATYGARTPADLDSLRQRQSNGPNGPDPETFYSRLPSVADWRDFTTVPRLARELLDQASGISVPSSSFVLRVLLAYMIALVPLNWLICRFVLNRREWAWVIVPLVALGFAIGVERMAARNLGYDTASDEIDLLEVYGDYPRAHLTRLGSLYSTGRTNFNLSYPNDPTALALPMDTGRSIRGEQVASSAWQSYPVPALVGLSVEPRSLSLYRAEQLLALKGPIRLEGEGENRRIVNESGQELKGATLIDMGGPAKPKEWYLGTIAAGASLEIGRLKDQPLPEQAEIVPGPDPAAFLTMLKQEYEDRSENQGELRLVAWVGDTVAGQVIEPPVDRRRGFTAVVVHLRCGNPPSPESIRYNLLAQGSEDDLFNSAIARARARMSARRPAQIRDAPRQGDGATLAAGAPRFCHHALDDPTRPVPSQSSGEKRSMIEVVNFTKRYGDFIAVDNLSFAIGKGEIFGFIGPNGAGKSTTIRFLATLLRPTSGEGRVAGHSVTAEPMAVRRVIGFMPDDFGVYDGMKVWEFLDFFAVAYEIPRAYRKKIIGEVLDLLDLTPQARRLRQRALQGHEAATLPGQDARARPARADPGRTGIGPRPEGAARDEGACSMSSSRWARRS